MWQYGPTSDMSNNHPTVLSFTLLDSSVVMTVTARFSTSLLRLKVRTGGFSLDRRPSPGEEFSGQLHIKYGPLPHLVASFTDYAGRCWHKRRVGRSKLQRTCKGSIIGIPVTVERQNPPTSC